MNLNESLLDRIFRKRCSLNNSMINLSKELSQKDITVGILSNTEPASYAVMENLTSLDHSLQALCLIKSLPLCLFEIIL